MPRFSYISVVLLLNVSEISLDRIIRQLVWSDDDDDDDNVDDDYSILK